MPSLIDALIQQESSGRRGVLGPQTKYGRAMGLTQVMPATGEEMARKLGIPWRPDLMAAKTDEAGDYQRAIGEAYLQEGLQKTGNVRDALRYYHGGPDRRQWGPKTNAYAENVLALAGNDQAMMPPQNVPSVMGGNQMPRPQDMLDEPIMGQGSLADMMQVDPGQFVQNTPQVKPGAFDKGGKGWVIAGIIADAIAGGFGGRGGFAPTYLATQQDEREQEQRRADYQQSRQDRLEDIGLALQKQIALKEYDRANPAPPTPSSAARMAVESGLKPGTPEFVQFIRQYAQRPIMIGGQPYGYEGGPASGGQTQVVDGVTYYNIDGEWYDNPEGQ